MPALVVGGVLADRVWWRRGFFLNVPIGIAMTFAADRLIGETERRQGLTGAPCGNLGMTALVINEARASGHPSCSRMGDTLPPRCHGEDEEPRRGITGGDWRLVKS